ncbi:hypothetical protein LTS18_009555 [Coniosporium uncinatum]|uniref:Uncharacterized protein n=1 Tax=Coniosporium uncinatum TaxID=93489 RepID=A0ACC3DYT3_9PEZI|nr:hypothetical protein LTS18_009555 [Coniosporium uncinatum]
MVFDMSKLGKFTESNEGWDVVVVGAGHNSLIAAAYIASAGKKVLVLERNSYAGGGVVSMEMAEPGYWSERHAALHFHILANPLITNDELGLLSRYGLDYIPIEIPYAVVLENDCLPFYQDRAKTQDCIATYSKDDATSYGKFMDLAIQITELLVPAMYEPPREFSELIAGSPLASIITETAAMSSYALIKSWFKHDVVQLALARFVSETQLAHPLKPGTALFCFILMGMLEKWGTSVPRGGGSAFTGALIKCIREHGGDVRVDSEVTKIVVKDGKAIGVRTRAGDIKAREAVVGSIHPHLLDRFVDGLDQELVRAAKNTTHADYTGFVIHAALKEPIRMKAGPRADMAVMNTICAPSLKDMLDSYDDVDQGKFPRNAHFGASCLSAIDPSRAPVGKAVLHFFCMTKYDIKGGAKRWDEVKDEYAQEIFGQLQRYTHNLTPELISSYHVVTPLDHERDSPSFQHGDITALGQTFDQTSVNRPTPALAQYRVPGVKGLYLAGPFMHPGGGVWGGGRPVARRVLEDLGVDFDAKFVHVNERIPRPKM